MVYKSKDKSNIAQLTNMNILQSILPQLTLEDINEQDKDQYGEKEVEGNLDKKTKELRLISKNEKEEEIERRIPKYPVHMSRKSLTAMELVDHSDNRELASTEVYELLSERVGCTNKSDLNELLFSSVSDGMELPRKPVRHTKKERSHDFRLSMPVSKGEIEEEYGASKTERKRTRNTEIEQIKRWSRQSSNVLSPEQRQKAIIRNAIKVNFLYEV